MRRFRAMVGAMERVEDGEVRRCRACEAAAEAGCAACGEPVCAAHQEAVWCQRCEAAFASYQAAEGRRRWRGLTLFLVVGGILEMSVTTPLLGIACWAGLSAGAIFLARPRSDYRERFIAGSVPRAALRGGPLPLPGVADAE
jgi:hypothetical protein